jgi:hypothetical protein
MLKNVNTTKEVLILQGFEEMPVMKGDKQTVMIKGDIKAIINPNGSVTVGDKTFDFRSIKRGKFNI